MYSCRSDSSTTAHTAAAADMESSGYSYGYSFNNNPYSQGLFHTPFPSPVINRRLASAAGGADSVSGGASEHHRGVYRMDPHLTCLKLGKRKHLDKSFAVKPYSGGSDLGASSATAAPKCQVDGCQAALVSAKEYHRRHKVCEVHAKAAVVAVLGVNQRFCQQCSRFHLVSEFDESKRSCRSRLAGHNKRRRKSSNVSTTATSHGSIAASHWRAPSLLSSMTNTNAPSIVVPSDLSSRSSAALRELIDEHRATTILAGNHHNSSYWPPRFEMQGEGTTITLDLMQGPRLVTNAINSKAKEEEPYFGLWNSFL